VTVRGQVTPAPQGKVTVALFRKRGGAFVRVASKTGSLNRGAFAASFRRPPAGTCRATAAYRGDARHRPSRANTTFGC
jgi:hypothetical protein